MENYELPQNWPETKRKLMEKYPQLAEEDLKYEIVKDGELLEQLQKKLGKNWKEIKETLSLLG